MFFSFYCLGWGSLSWKGSALLALCFSDHLRSTGLCIINLYGQHRKCAGGHAFVPQMVCGLMSKIMLMSVEKTVL